MSKYEFLISRSHIWNLIPRTFCNFIFTRVAHTSLWQEEQRVRPTPHVWKLKNKATDKLLQTVMMNATMGATPCVFSPSCKWHYGSISMCALFVPWMAATQCRTRFTIRSREPPMLSLFDPREIASAVHRQHGKEQASYRISYHLPHHGQNNGALTPRPIEGFHRGIEHSVLAFQILPTKL